MTFFFINYLYFIKNFFGWNFKNINTKIYINRILNILYFVLFFLIKFIFIFKKYLDIFNKYNLFKKTCNFTCILI